MYKVYADSLNKDREMMLETWDSSKVVDHFVWLTRFCRSVILEFNGKWVSCNYMGGHYNLILFDSSVKELPGEKSLGKELNLLI